MVSSIRMHVNQCPICGKTAMSFWSKFMGKSLECLHCQSKLRLRFAPTVALGLVIYISILFIGVNFGINRASILFAICCLFAFLVACLFIPLEVRSKDQKS